MNAAIAPTPIRSAWPELAVLAAASRPDWPEDVINGVLRRAYDDGMAWETALHRIPRLMTDPDAVPGDLLDDPKALFRRKEQGDYALGAAATREAFQEAPERSAAK
jgi:hypothetical protein